MSSSLLSDSERNSLYVVSFNSSGDEEIVNGSIIDAGAAIVAAISKLPGAPEPAAVEIALESDGSREAAVVRAQTPRFKPSGEGESSATWADAREVDEIRNELPELVVPGSIAAGAYEIVTSILDDEGEALQRSRIAVFAGTPRPVIESVTSFPPAVEPGAPVLLSLAISRAAGEGEGSAPLADYSWDPWIVWSADGKRFAEGPLSAGLDTTVWQTPGIAGTYTIAAQVYPAAPPRGRDFSFRAAARQNLQVMMARAPRGESGDDFADSLSFLCLLRLDGDFADSGTRPRIAQPEAFGSPRLEVYDGGFGYRLGASAGVSVPELMPPAQDGRLLPFSVIVRLAPDPDRDAGEIARFASADGGYSLVLGLEGGKPYVEFSFDGKVQRSSASTAVPASPMTLEADFRPAGERLDIAWRAEGERIAAPSMPLPPAPPKGGAVIGGSLSLPGVYDGFGLSSGASSPAYRLASRRKWKDKLILAEGFEDGKLPGSSSSQAGATVASGGLTLAPGASLSLEPPLDTSTPVAVEVAMSGDKPSARIDFVSAGGARAFSVSGTGEVLDASGAALGVVAARQGRISIGISASDGRYLVSSGEAAPVAVRGDPATLFLILRRDGGTDASSAGKEGDAETLSIESVLARRAPAPAAAPR